jgi:hypothetical protein
MQRKWLIGRQLQLNRSRKISVFKTRKSFSVLIDCSAVFFAEIKIAGTPAFKESGHGQEIPA